MIKDDFLSGIFYSVPNLRYYHSDKLSKVKLGNICSITGGYAFDSRKMKSKGEYQIIKMGNLYNGVLDLTRNPSFIDNPTKKELEYLIHKNDILITLTGTVNKKDYGYTVQLNNPNNLLLNQRCALIKPLNINEKYLFYLLNSNNFFKQFYASSTGGTGNQTNVSINDMLNFNMYIANEKNQIIISEFLNKIDQRIETQIKIIDSIKSQKQQIRNILFNDIHQTPNCCVQDYVAYEQPQKYIVHDSNYLPYSKVLIPVLTANQSFILGYTSENDGIYKKGDCIIFDDFTNESKYVNFPFKVKSSALKILQTKEGLLLKFFYEYLQFLNFEAINHKRHYLSEVAITEINVPDLKKQSYVCKVLSSVDIKLKNEEIILKNYKLQKHFLLANLFV